MESKIVPEYIDHGLGFPVVLERVHMVKVRGRWTPKINYKDLEREVLQALTALDGRLTGNQVRFIRLQAEMTLTQFAERLGVTHAAVVKWEKTGNKPTAMSWSTEKDIRLLSSRRLKPSPKDFVALYEQLERVGSRRGRRVKLDGERLVA